MGKNKGQQVAVSRKRRHAAVKKGGHGKTVGKPNPATAKSPQQHNKGASWQRERRRTKQANGFWLWGRHPVLAALANPARRCRRLLVEAAALARRDEALADALAKTGAQASTASLVPESATREALANLLPAGALHQGLALLVEPLSAPDLEDILQQAGDGPLRLIALDQVSDPQNVGAVLRSAAALGATAVIQTKRHAPGESGALAKAASGALEVVPLLAETNLARCLRQLQAAGVFCLGLAGEAELTLAAAAPGPRSCLVLGAEGRGLRRLTREACDLLVRLPTQGPIQDLNVSAAAAIGLYELARSEI